VDEALSLIVKEGNRAGEVVWANPRAHYEGARTKRRRKINDAIIEVMLSPVRGRKQWRIGAEQLAEVCRVSREIGSSYNRYCLI